MRIALMLDCDALRAFASEHGFAFSEMFHSKSLRRLALSRKRRREFIFKPRPYWTSVLVCHTTSRALRSVYGEAAWRDSCVSPLDFPFSTSAISRGEGHNETGEAVASHFEAGHLVMLLILIIRLLKIQEAKFIRTIRIANLGERVVVLLPKRRRHVGPVGESACRRA
jgi:hypothetical protein